MYIIKLCAYWVMTILRQSYPSIVLGNPCIQIETQRWEREEEFQTERKEIIQGNTNVGAHEDKTFRLTLKSRSYFYLFCDYIVKNLCVYCPMGSFWSDNRLWCLIMTGNSLGKYWYYLAPFDSYAPWWQIVFLRRIWVIKVCNLFTRQLFNLF